MDRFDEQLIGEGWRDSHWKRSSHNASVSSVGIPALGDSSGCPIYGPLVLKFSSKTRVSYSMTSWAGATGLGCEIKWACASGLDEYSYNIFPGLDLCMHADGCRE